MFEKLKWIFINKYKIKHFGNSKFTHKKLIKALSVLKILPGSESPFICEMVGVKFGLEIMSKPFCS